MKSLSDSREGAVAPGSSSQSFHCPDPPHRQLRHPDGLRLGRRGTEQGERAEQQGERGEEKSEAGAAGETYLIGVRRSAFGVRRSAFGVRRSAFGVRRSAFGVRRSAFGVRRSAFGVRRSAFGVRRSAFGVRRSLSPMNADLMSRAFMPLPPLPEPAPVPGCDPRALHCLVPLRFGNEPVFCAMPHKWVSGAVLSRLGPPGSASGRSHQPPSAATSCPATSKVRRSINTPGQSACKYPRSGDKRDPLEDVHWRVGFSGSWEDCEKKRISIGRWNLSDAAERPRTPGHRQHQANQFRPPRNAQLAVDALDVGADGALGAA